MKQHITKEQWDELSKDGQNALKEFIGFDNLEEHIYNITIGEMIEFLGKDLYSIKRLGEDYEVWTLLAVGFEEMYAPKKEELADALWEAVKFKLIES
jgi:hypothetical protein|tara:strand:- start:920 stop:1210 length:291 start_codon:yes stop_codon:yes gene_type:complete